MNRDAFEVGRAHAQQYAQVTRDRASESIRGNINKIDFHPEDLLRPPTLITGLGALLVRKGTCADAITTVEGVHSIRNGRALDVADGIVARSFDMESDAGALADVVADKIEQLMIAIAALRHDALPKTVVGYLVAKNLAHTILTIAASLSHPGERPTTPRANKYAMFLENIGAGLLLEANAYEQEQPEHDKHSRRKKLGIAALAASVCFEAFALKELISRLDQDTPLS